MSDIVAAFGEITAEPQPALVLCRKYELDINKHLIPLKRFDKQPGRIVFRKLKPKNLLLVWREI